jgi:hypothetical protein
MRGGHHIDGLATSAPSPRHFARHCGSLQESHTLPAASSWGSDADCLVALHERLRLMLRK